MATVKVSGASDDYIEIEGDISEEFNGDKGYLAFSDGTLLRIEYGKDGGAFWRITPVRYGTAKYEKVEATDEREDYSDHVTLTGNNLAWVMYGESYAVAPKRRDEASVVSK